MTNISNISFLIKCFYFVTFGLLEQQVEGKLGVQECANLGFTSHLMCGSCALLSDFKLSTLEEDCLQCCESEVDDDGSTKFPFATLEVCG